MNANLVAPRYEFGELDLDHRELPWLTERAVEFGMPPRPELWGWGRYRRTERDPTDLAVAAGRASLSGAGLTGADVDALVLCSTRFPGGPEDHGEFVQPILKGIGVTAPYYGMTLNRCATLLSAVAMATALVLAGTHRRILLVTVDRVTDERTRMARFALFSDGAASCVISAEAGQDAYAVLGCASAQDPTALGWTNEISSDLARTVNDRLLGDQGLVLTDVAALLHNNLFTPIVVMKERQAGFTAGQLDTSNTRRYGHCFAADPLINLADRAEAGRTRPGEYLMLAASVPGVRAGVLVRRLPY